MSFTKIIKREMEVAFSKHAQPVWLRVLKYILLGLFLYFFWGTKILWISLPILFVLALALHFWFRYKTRGWTKTYGPWKYDENKPGLKNK